MSSHKDKKAEEKKAEEKKAEEKKVEERPPTPLESTCRCGACRRVGARDGHQRARICRRQLYVGELGLVSGRNRTASSVDAVHPGPPARDFCVCDLWRLPPRSRVVRPCRSRHLPVCLCERLT
jgi:hypothetical protein